MYTFVLNHDAGQPTDPLHSQPQDSYPMGQQVPSESAHLNAPAPDYSAGKFIVRWYYMCVKN